MFFAFMVTMDESPTVFETLTSARKRLIFPTPPLIDATA